MNNLWADDCFRQPSFFLCFICFINIFATIKNAFSIPEATHIILLKSNIGSTLLFFVRPIRILIFFGRVLGSTPRNVFLYSENKIQKVEQPHTAENSARDIQVTAHHHKKAESHYDRNGGHDLDFCYPSHSAPLSASTISIFLFLRATISPTSKDTPKVSAMLTI